MANYYATTRTNYFSVTDEEKFRAIIASCQSEDVVSIFEDSQEDGSKKFAFGCYSNIFGILKNEDDEADLDCLFTALQGILCERDAILYTEIGNEKLRYLTAYCVIITKDAINVVNLCNCSLELAKTVLDDVNFTTKTDY